MGGGGGAAPAPPAQPASPAAADDLLGFDMGMGAPAPPPPQQQAQAAPAPFLAPMQVTTQQVGQMWGQLPAESKVQMQTSITSPQELMMRLQRSLNVHPVEIIGTEGIAAGRVLPGNDPCFFHGKLAPPRLDILMKGRDQGVLQRAEAICRQALA